MNREFFLNITFLIFINFIIKPVYILAIEVNVQNAVGPEAYGIYFSLFNFCFLFQIINDLGIQNYNSRNIALNKNELSYNLDRILGTKFILSILFLITIFIVALILNYDPSIYKLLLLIAFNQIILSTLLYFRSNIAASGKYRIDSLLSVVDKIFLIIILAYLLWFGPEGRPFQIEWFVLSQTAALSFALLAALFYNFKLAKKISIKWSKTFSKDLLKKSYPYAVIIFLMLAYTRMDGIMLERMLDDRGYSAGVYAAGFRLLDAANMIGFLFATLLLPMFASLLTKSSELQKLVKMSFSLIFALAIIICFASCFFRNEIMVFLYPRYANDDYGLLFAYLMISFVAMSLGYIFGTLITASGKLKSLNLVFFVGIIINFSLNLYLIPRNQYIGAATATIITQYAVLIGQIFIVLNRFPIKINFIAVINHVAFIIASYTSFYVLVEHMVIHWIYKIILGIILAFIISLVFKLIDLRSFRNTLMPEND